MGIALKLREANMVEDFYSVISIIESYHFEATEYERFTDNFRREFEEHRDSRIIFLGETDARLAGTVQLVLRNADNDPELANGCDIAHVHNLWVAKPLLRRGLALQIMVQLESKALALGITSLTLGVEDNNIGAVALYQRLGYFTFKCSEGRIAAETLLLMRKNIWLAGKYS